MGNDQRRPIPRPSILYVASGQSITSTRKWLLQAAGYSVILARTTEAALQQLDKPRRLDLLLIGTVTRGIDVTAVETVAQRRKPKMFIVTLSRTPDQVADFHIEPLAGPEALLRVVGEAVVTSHGHRFNKNSRAMFVDRDRRYIHVTDAAAELVGYSREELLGCRIDDLATPEMDVREKFKSYVRDGSQQGVFALRHRNGSTIRVQYTATILDDGCMVSRLKKINTAA